MSTLIRIYIRAGPKFERLYDMDGGILLEILKYPCRFPKIGNSGNDHLSYTLRGVVFSPTHVDPNA